MGLAFFSKFLFVSYFVFFPGFGRSSIMEGLGISTKLQGIQHLKKKIYTTALPNSLLQSSSLCRREKKKVNNIDKKQTVIFTTDGNRCSSQTGQMSRISNWDHLNNRSVVKSAISIFFHFLFHYCLIFSFSPHKSILSDKWNINNGYQSYHQSQAEGRRKKQWKTTPSHRINNKKESPPKIADWLA